MVKMSCSYEGKLHCSLTHEPSGTQIETDAPKDNLGLGERFSPSDLVGAALGSCILTTMAIVAERDGIQFSVARAEVEKEMTTGPRRISALRVKVTMPPGLTPQQKKKLEETAHHCPVHRSLHPDVQLPIIFVYREA